jgi:hypothetical protein
MILGTAAALRRHGSGWPPSFAHDGVDAVATPFGDSLGAFNVGGGAALKSDTESCRL